MTTKTHMHPIHVSACQFPESMVEFDFSFERFAGRVWVATESHTQSQGKGRPSGNALSLGRLRQAVWPRH